MENQLVVFDLAREHYGLDIAAVEGIIKMQAITGVPHAPAFVEGVTNLRGKVLPVVDLRLRDVEPMVYNFLVNFAKENELQVRPGRVVPRSGDVKAADAKSGSAAEGAQAPVAAGPAAH